jgi:hypothetical protein
MNMHARFGIAILTGVLLGVLIIGSAVYLPFHRPGTASYLVRYVIYSSSTSTNSSQAVLGSVGPVLAVNTTRNSLNGTSFSANILMPQVGSIGKQPPLQLVVLLLPVVTAVFFGLIMYRVSTVRHEEEPSKTP